MKTAEKITSRVKDLLDAGRTVFYEGNSVEKIEEKSGQYFVKCFDFDPVEFVDGEEHCFETVSYNVPIFDSFN